MGKLLYRNRYRRVDVSLVQDLVSVNLIDLGILCQHLRQRKNATRVLICAKFGMMTTTMMLSTTNIRMSGLADEKDQQVDVKATGIVLYRYCTILTRFECARHVSAFRFEPCRYDTTLSIR